jgi:DNA-binding CsgD family transcriptional regulator
MLIGRTAECARINQLLADARVGASGVLVLHGDAGIGKSALLAYAREQAVGMAVLTARGVESEADIPFAGLLELLRPALTCLDRVPGPQAHALGGALGLGVAVPGDRFIIGAATLSLLTTYAEQAPLLLLIDDVQWLDHSSTDALIFALRRLLADPIAVILTQRSGEPAPGVAAGLPDLFVDGLDRDAARALLRDRASGMVPEATFEWLYRATAGNPLALAELARTAPSLQVDLFDRPLPVSTRLEQAFARRMQPLPDSARRAVLIAAAVDSADTATILAAAAALEAGTLDLEQAEAVGLLRIGASSIDFHHPLIRSVAYHSATPVQRRAAHAAIAAVLTNSRDADRRAWHLATATIGPSDAVALALEDAARRARERSAYAAAATAFERAASLSSTDEARARRLFAAAEAAWLAGAAQRAVHLLEDALERTQDVLLRADIHYLHGRALLHGGSVMAGHNILVDGATQVQALDPAKATAMLAEAAWGLLYAGAADGMSETARQAWDLSASAPDDERAAFFGSIAYGMALIFTGQDAAEGARLVRRATAIMERSDSLYRSPQMVAWTGMGPLWLRENAAGRDLLYRAVDMAREQGAMGELPLALSPLALDSASSDRWPAAYAQFSEVIDLARETGQPSLECMGLAGLCRLEARQGRTDDCTAHAAEALALADRFGLGVYRIWARLGLGELALGLGLPEDAIRHGEAVCTWLAELGIRDPDLSPIPELVLAYVQVGRLADARDASQEYARHALEKGQPWALARAARCTGLLADETAFERHFVDALRFHDLTPDSFESARTQLHYGERLRRVRRRIHARVQLRAAFATFERLGAAPWADRARVELLATGETARRRDASTIDQLTPQEFQIAQLLAEGATTREAAAKLFLSPKTIEYHLRSVYSKLGIRSRSALTSALGDQVHSATHAP